VTTARLSEYHISLRVTCLAVLSHFTEIRLWEQGTEQQAGYRARTSPVFFFAFLPLQSPALPSSSAPVSVTTAVLVSARQSRMGIPAQELSADMQCSACLWLAAACALCLLLTTCGGRFHMVLLATSFTHCAPPPCSSLCPASLAPTLPATTSPAWCTRTTLTG
jgi:hypothetical protein